MTTQKIKLSEVRQLVRNILKEEKSNKKFIKEELEDELIDFTVPDWSMGALINGDYSGLSDEDEAKVNEFVDEVSRIYGNAMFMDANEDLGFCPRNDIDKLGSNCNKVLIRPDKMQESVKPKTQKIKLSEVREMVRKSLREGKYDYQTYHNSFTEAASEAKEYAEKKGYKIDEDSWWREVGSGGKYGRSRPKIGVTHTFTIDLLKDDKPQKKALIFTVYGMDSGRYELVVYIN
jgi:hypothetical protein